MLLVIALVLFLFLFWLILKRAISPRTSIISSTALQGDFVIKSSPDRQYTDSLVEPQAVEDYKFKIIYFYPSDYSPNQQLINAINPFVSDVQSWMLKQLGKTFAFMPVQVIQGDKTAAQYGSGTNSTYAIYYEVKQKTNATQADNYIIYVPETIQFSCCAVFFGSGAYQSKTGDGFAMIDDAVFDPDIIGPGGTCRNGDKYNATPACNPQSRRGGTAHEIGHVLSLPHPQDCDTNNRPSYCHETIMYAWWGFPSTGLLDTPVAPEKKALLESPWIGGTNTPTPISGQNPDPNAICTTVRNNGPSTQKLDITFIPMGYSADQLTQFREEVSSLSSTTTGLLRYKPFSDYPSSINIHRIDSTAIGLNDLYIADRLKQLATICNSDQIVVIKNDPNFSGGGGGGIAYVGNQTLSSPGIIAHEFGHSFGDLSEEYIYPEFYDGKPNQPPSGPNCSKTSSAPWVGFPDTGLFQGCSFQSYFRSSENSIMRDSSQTRADAFDAWNIKILTDKLASYDPTQPVPTTTPTLTQSSTLTPTPTDKPIVTLTGAPGETGIAVSIKIDGIGNNLGVGENNNPIRPNQPLNFQISDEKGEITRDGSRTIAYDSSSGLFKGSLTVQKLPVGTYRIKLRMLNSLWKETTFTLTGQTANLAIVKIITGDIYFDNSLDILDYNGMLACFRSDPWCTTDTQKNTDLNIDGFLDEKDLNILLRAFKNR